MDEEQSMLRERPMLEITDDDRDLVLRSNEELPGRWHRPGMLSCIFSLVLLSACGLAAWPHRASLRSTHVTNDHVVERFQWPWEGGVPVNQEWIDQAKKNAASWDAMQRRKAAGIAAEKLKSCGDVGNNAGTMISPALHADSSCSCAALCANTTGCAGWTYSLGSFVTLDDENTSLNCWLRSDWSSMVGNCNSDCYSAAVFSPSDAKKKAKKKAQMKRSFQCKASTPQHNMATIGDKDFPGVADWEDVNAKAYAAISRCLTASVCEPGNVDDGNEDVRKTYATNGGTSMLFAYQGRLSNYDLMDDVAQKAGCKSADFSDTRLILQQEVTQLQLVAGWFDVYFLAYIAIQRQLNDAFANMVTLLAIPAETQIPEPPSRWVSILTSVLSVAASYWTFGGAMHNTMVKADARTGPGFTAIGSAMSTLGTTIDKASKCMNNCVQDETGGVATLPPQMADLAATALAYQNIVALLEYLLGNVLEVIEQQRSVIMSNRGRLLAASEIASECPLDQLAVERATVGAFGAMQWVALGVLMPSKYVIYYQRDYDAYTISSPECDYDGDAKGCTGSTMGCWYTEPSSKVDGCDFKKTTCESQHAVGAPCPDPEDTYYSSSTGALVGRPSDGIYTPPSCGINAEAMADAPVKRAVWVGEVSDPSLTPSSDFWAALTKATTGPIGSFVNPAFGTMYEGASGGWEAFVSQCQYMPVAANKPGQVLCNVYGIPIPTYSLSDCQYQWQPNDVQYQCVNGAKDFNQRVYIPNKKRDWSKDSDGTVACCEYWNETWMENPSQSGCDFAICSCSRNPYAGQETIPPFWSKCSADAVTTLGPGCDWQAILESEGNLSACR